MTPITTIPPQQTHEGIFKIMHVISEFYANGIDDHPWVFALLIIVVLDIILGVSRAWAVHSFSSSKFRKGLVGHVATVFIVAFAYPFAMFMGLTAFVDTFISGMLLAYGASILANLSALGVKIPYLDNFIRNNIDKDKFDVEESNFTDKEG